MKKKRFKFLINFFVILVVLSLVLYFSLKDNYQEIVGAILHMNVIFILIAILILVIYRLCASLGHYLVIRSNHEVVSFVRCVQINFIILFFHGITPFAGGGQPMEVYYLHNENIPVTKATNITLQNFIVYQISLVIVGIFALIYNGVFGVFSNSHLMKRLVMLGFSINFLVLVVTFVLSFGKRVNQFVCQKGIHLLSKFRLIKDEEKFQEKFQEYFSNFYQNALELRKNRGIVLGAIMVNILGLLVLYSMPYVIGVGLGVDVTLIQAMVATAYIMIIGSFVPIPGGTGGIEYGFVFFFGYFIRGSILNAMMLVWRFVSYYLGIVFGAIALAIYRKKGKVCE